MVRQAFTAELEQVRLQVEVMAVRVDQNLGVHGTYHGRWQALGRIADHAAIIGVRLRYLITGDPDHLATETR